MRKLCLMALLLVATVAAAQTKSPVLVELFTSEGCSSCPPADRLLIKLDQQPIAGVQIIVLGEHVDYWDKDGWKDRFSSSLFTSRQNAYAGSFNRPSVYTPQMVVNGKVEFVGNDSEKAVAAIRSAAQTYATPASIRIERTGDHLHVSVSDAGHRSLNVYCAITEQNLSTHVGGGENGGRDLQHTAVVRDLRRLGSTRNGTFESDAPLNFASGWIVPNLRAVVFLQRGDGGQIYGASQISLAPAK